MTGERLSHTEGRSSFASRRHAAAGSFAIDGPPDAPVPPPVVVRGRPANAVAFESEKKKATSLATEYTGTLKPLQFRELCRGPAERGSAFLDDDERLRAWIDHQARILAGYANTGSDKQPWAEQHYAAGANDAS